MAISGIFLGAFGGLFGLLYGRKKAQQNRGLDERYEAISKNALANGWKVTLGGIYVFWILLILDVQISAAEVLGILLLIHMIGWAGFRIYYQLKS
jgi:hypothetical protein